MQIKLFPHLPQVNFEVHIAPNALTPIFQWRLTSKTLEELAEEGRIGEVRFIGDLCHSFVAVYQLDLNMGE